MSFTALVLAGGRSTRMGEDKAFVEIDGETLVARQVRRARRAGAVEVLVSGRAGADYGVADVRVVHDLLPDRGPLGGLERGLALARHPMVLVLAVDMPFVPDDWLSVGDGRERGLVPRLREELEPLAAWYPKRAHALVVVQLAAGRLAARELARRCVEEDLVELRDVALGDERFFQNWNHRADMHGGERDERR